jgi:glyoxylase-like metal-dependent hydrolase (beta-lactamase superfamily II)
MEISAKPVKWLVYTHYHGDHNLGAGAFIAKWPQMHILSTEATRQSMTSAPMDYIKTYSKGNQDTLDLARDQLKRSNLSQSMRRGWEHMAEVGPAMVSAYKQLNAYPADTTFTDEVTLSDPKCPVEVSFLGKANTDGDAIVWLEQQSVLITGDILVSPIPYASASYPKQWVNVLDQLDRYHYAFLIPGHGDIQMDHQYLRLVKAALYEISAQVDMLTAKGDSLEQVNKEIDLSDVKTKFAGTDDFDQFLLANFFLEAIVSNAYKEAKSLPIIQGHEGG